MAKHAKVRKAAARKVRIPRVGILTPAENDETAVFAKFREGLRDLDYIEGESITLDFRFAKGHADALPVLAAELVKIPVDVIVVDGLTAARAAINLTQSVPIVGVGGDPVAAGIAASYARPGGNFTGFSIRPAEMSGERLRELVKYTKTPITCVTVLLEETNVNTPTVFYATWKVADELNVRLKALVANTPDDLRNLRPAVLAGSNGFMTFPGAMFYNHCDTVIRLPEAAGVPGIYPEKEYVNAGGWLYHGYDVQDTFQRAATYVDRILRGDNPGDMPIEEATQDKPQVNLVTGDKLGLPPPPGFMGVGR